MIVMTVAMPPMSPVTVSVSAPVTVVVIVPGTQAGAGSHVLEYWWLLLSIKLTLEQLIITWKSRLLPWAAAPYPEPYTGVLLLRISQT